MGYKNFNNKTKQHFKNVIYMFQFDFSIQKYNLS